MDGIKSLGHSSPFDARSCESMHPVRSVTMSALNNVSLKSFSSAFFLV